MDTRWVRKGSWFVEESLIKWKCLPQNDATWEDAQELKKRFLNMNLEDKVLMKDEGIDKLIRSQRVPKKNPRFLI